MASERKIGAHVYRCEKLPAEEGLQLLLRVTAFFRPMPAMLGSLVAKQTDSAAIAAFTALILGDELDRGEAQSLLTDLVRMCRCGGDPCVVGMKPESLVDVVKVAWFAMETNLKDFLSESLRDSLAPPEQQTGA